MHENKMFLDKCTVNTCVSYDKISFVATSQTFESWGHRARQYLAAAITGICQTKISRSRGVGDDLLCHNINNLIPDGDWKHVSTPITASDEQITALGTSVFQSPAIVQSMLLCISATKANWWSMNHHTGQGAMVGYALKVANVHLADLQENVRMSLMHLMGHWCSSIRNT